MGPPLSEPQFLAVLDLALAMKHLVWNKDTDHRDRSYPLSSALRRFYEVLSPNPDAAKVLYGQVEHLAGGSIDDIAWTDGTDIDESYNNLVTQLWLDSHKNHLLFDGTTAQNGSEVVNAPDGTRNQDNVDTDNNNSNNNPSDKNFHVSINSLLQGNGSINGGHANAPIDSCNSSLPNHEPQRHNHLEAPLMFARDDMNRRQPSSPSQPNGNDSIIL